MVKVHNIHMAQKSPVDVIAAAKMHLVENMTDIIWTLYFAYG
jgi:hypothetical protein